MDAEVRRQRLLEILQRDGRIRIEAASAELSVSSMTVRRDLADLEAAGDLRRVRGGAVPSLRPRSFTDRMARRADAKRVIAEKVAHLVPQHGAIALDASSTAGVVLGGVPRVDGRQVIAATNSYENFGVARGVEGLSALLVGGEAEEQTDSFVGHIACQAAASLHYSTFFVSAAAVDPDGPSEVTLAETQVKFSFADASDETVLIVDSSKLGQRALVRGLAWDRIGMMVTELDPADPALEAYRGRVELL
ncbi:DeoR/GlpR family DNA-binding transcription regulator [Zhihengliuella alba]|uniref:DeoR/GlpR family DNA-binding transcription regulator n=1 Tax=Zhihengliuella alba TaxID=547018 RepID=A0ABP7E2K4_9MICC